MKSLAIISRIQAKLCESDPSKRTITNIFQFHFTDIEGNRPGERKSYVFDFGELKIYEGISDKADAEITMADEDFHALGSRQTTFEQLVSSNKAQIKGNTEAIRKMMDKFRLGSQKSP